MTVSRSEFERLESDVKASYKSIQEYLQHLETHIDQGFNEQEQKFNERLGTLDQKINTLDDKFDGMSRRLADISEDVSHLRSSFTERFEVTASQFRIVDKEQIRFDERLRKLERWVHSLEHKDS